ncbi:response regulator [Paenibacillaceae bacterium]|nr:response regulator [Paenibacillaceae bacterium]
MTKSKIMLICGMFLILLTGARLLWVFHFIQPNQHHAVQGVLNLRDSEISNKQTFLLDGEWEFYPNTLLMHDSIDGAAPSEPQFIQVPGSWNAALNPEQPTPYGSGSYRLRIVVDAADMTEYAIRIPSIRSSSELYINGQPAGQSGQPAATAAAYQPLNINYISDFTLEGSNEITVVIHAANYDYPRSSGIVSSLKFGTEAAIKRELAISVLTKIMVCIAFLIHAVYVLIIYLMGMRNKILLYFFFIAVCAIIAMLEIGDNLLLYLFPIPYEWSFRIIPALMISASFLIVQTVKPKLKRAISKSLVLVYNAVCVAALATLALPASLIATLDWLYLFLLFVAMVSALILLLRIAYKGMAENILMLLTFIAIFSSVVWAIVFNLYEIRSSYYPFDIIVALITFSLIWFKRYMEVLSHTRALTSQLQESDTLKDYFLANTSHELRNPLHGMLNLSEAVLEREKSTLSKKSSQDLELLLTVGRRMSFMLNDLLDMIRLKERRIHLLPQNLSLPAVAAGVLDMLRFMTDGKPIQLLNRIPNGFPAIIADENRLIQILFNLLHNAVKYTYEGEVSIHAKIVDGKARIVIEDTGIGMDEEILQRVFEPYAQASGGGSRPGGGFGLGLNICRQLVEMHDSKLEATSKPNVGSRFSFSLPLSEEGFEPMQQAYSSLVSAEPGLQEATDMGRTAADAAQAQAAATAADQLVSAAAAKLAPVHGFDIVRVLAVDDDPVNTMVIDNILSANPGYRVVTATSGKDALERLSEGEWDLIITDVMMPHMSGYELTATIRKRYSISELPVLLLTARNLPEDIDAGFLAGANDYVTKPVNPLELKSRVRALTELKRSINEQLRMEAAWLQAQIKPHFILNTFNVVAALSEIDPKRMIALVEEFGNYLRGSFDFQNSEQLAPLSHELDLLHSYLFIEQERFRERLVVEWDVDEDIAIEIPPLSIQPLVENAARHGILKRARGGSILIRIKEGTQEINIEIIDNGVGIDENKLNNLLNRKQSSSSGIGLINTDRRLKKIYGHGLQIKSVLGEGTTVSFVIPKQA